MNNSNEERLKIAVFIDVDNISIGVKQSMNRNFDIGTVLEAIKEKGEIITKIAYGDWKRADDFSRAMTQHAIQMVQRNATPGGDKNGADIALALDALETAFTRPHINAFVIVGGDSDFIALVEKLKQYDKTVFVVGGRGFTSVILQKNCHEFISYENLIGIHSSRKLTGRIQLSSHSTLGNALPLIRRALKILSDREVSPQLGLLKSTLLQLDSTFSERDYGVGSFREFIQKLADAGYVNLKQVDRSLLVELKDSFKEASEKDASEEEEKEAAEASAATALVLTAVETPVEEISAEGTPVETIATGDEPQTVEPPALETATLQAADADRTDASKALEELFRIPAVKPHWPLYLRTFKQLLRSQPTPFDERQYGLSSTYDLARQAQRDGLFRIERNRQGILRIFPGDRFPKLAPETMEELPESSPTEAAFATTAATPTTMMPETGIHDPETELIESAPVDSELVASSLVDTLESETLLGSEQQDTSPADVMSPQTMEVTSSESTPTDSMADSAMTDTIQHEEAAEEKPKAKPRTTRRKTTTTVEKPITPRSTATRKPRTPRTKK